MTKPRLWAPIEDIESPKDLASADLRSLAEVWREQSDRIKHQDSYQRFQAKLKREWAIETGLIERLYALDRGMTEMLIEHGIHAAVIPHRNGGDLEKAIAMISDHEAAVDHIFDFVGGGRALSTGYIKELHVLMTRNQETVTGLDALGRRVELPLLRGDWKKLPNNPTRPDGSIHEYCPPEHVASEMDRLIEWHLSHQDVAPEVEAAWLHHRFTQIHPFQDGNGRIARALATLVFVRAGWFPLVVRDADRKQYIDALEDADVGDLKPLVTCFADLHRAQLRRALSIAEEVHRERRVVEAIQSVSYQLRKRRDSIQKEQKSAISIASTLRMRAEERFGDVAIDLRHEMAGVFRHAEFTADGSKHRDARDHYFRYQLVQTAKQLDYFANTKTYRSWARLRLRTDNLTEFLVAFHGIGHEFQGVLACSACCFQRMEAETGWETGPVVPLTDAVFLINYREAQEEAEVRFSEWLEEAIVRGLKLWQEAAL